jgi:hypothetical protein
VSSEISTQNGKIIGVDVEITLAYFRVKEKEHHLFFYAIDRDDNGAARHIFWVYGGDRRAYLKFEYVITFKTTYNNK